MRNLSRWVWRANAYLIFTVCVGILIALLVGIVQLGSTLFGTRTQTYTDTALTAPDSTSTTQGKSTEQYSLGTAQLVAGTTYIFYPVTAQQERDLTGKLGSYDKEFRSDRNLLFVNTQTLTQTYLLPHTRFLLIAHEPCSEQKYLNTMAACKRTFFYYEVFKTDTNGDGLLSNADRPTLATSNADGTGYREVMDADALLELEDVNDDRLLVRYVQGGVSYLRIWQHRQRQWLGPAAKLMPLPAGS